LEEAMAVRDQVVFIDVLVDQHEHVYPMQVPNGAMADMFLSKTERT
jgi:acetolactate synthase-1/2/3 large subunit